MKVRYSITLDRKSGEESVLASGIVGPGPDGADTLAALIRDMLTDYFDLSQRSIEQGLEVAYRLHLESCPSIAKRLFGLDSKGNLLKAESDSP